MALAPSYPTRDANDSAIDILRSRIKGQVITNADADYAEARLIQNRTFDRYPDYVVQAISTSDVAEAIRFSREYHLPLSLRSGAHSVAGHSTNTGGVVLDMGQMRGIVVDPERRTARVQCGARAGEITAAAQEHGLILPMGDAETVAVSGLTLGGGIGWLIRKYGLTIDSLLSAELVTATGEVLTASADKHADLFWAIRGGGGNFGVVTEFEFALQPLGLIYGGALVLPATAEVITQAIELARTATNDLSVIGYVMHAPPLPFLREEDHGKLVLVLSAVFAGDHADADAVFAPFRAITEPLADILGPMPYAAMYELTKESTMPHRGAIRMMYADGLELDTCETVLEHMHHATSPMSMFQFRVLGGKCAEIAHESTAYAHRDRDLFLTFIGLWLEEGNDVAHRQWMMDLWNAVRHTGSGAYSNFMEDEGEARIRAAYPAETYRRLATVKAAYDPENVFNMNQNVRPLKD